MRGDFEVALQTVVARLARQLAHEGDFDGAAELLVKGLEALPGDGELEEISEDLRINHPPSG